MRVEGMHPWWDEEEEKRRAAAIKTREPEMPVNENSFYAGAVKSGIMGAGIGSGKFKTITDYEKAIDETEKTIVDLSHQQYEHMMNGDQPKMDALTPMIGQALNVRDQLRVEMGNQMGLGTDGWASQGKSYTGSYETQLNNKDEMTEFVKKVKEAEANIPPGQGMYGRNKESAPIYENVIPVTEIPKGQSPFDDAPPIWGPYIIDPNKKREDIKEFLLSDDGDQSKPRGGGGFNNPLGMNGYGNNRVQLAANDSVPMMELNDEKQEYIDSMSQTYGGMSEGLEGAQSNSRESIINSLSPELRPKADVYVGMGKANGNDENMSLTSVDEKDEDKGILDIFGDVVSGKWIFDAATGGMKWVQENAESIEKVYQEAQAFEAADNPTKYNLEKQKRFDDLQYAPSEDFSSLISNGLNSAQNSLSIAQNIGDEQQIAECKQEVALYDAIANMYTTTGQDSSFRYYAMEIGMQAVQSLIDTYQEDIRNASNDIEYEKARGKLSVVNEEMIAINRGMNVAGEAYLDDIDEKYKTGKISPEDREMAYKDYYTSVMERESLIDIESRSLKEDNLTIVNATANDVALLNILEGFDVPLYSAEEDAVFAFKKEAMPVTLETDKEHSAILDKIDILDVETGQVKTYYYYLDVRQGAETNVAFHALLGAGGGEDRKLLHTHPVDGGWSRYFSGNPENHGIFNKNPDRESPWGEWGDSSVPDWMGYGGIYVVTSGAEVKLYEGFGEADIGSGQNTYANTEDELFYVSTIDVY